MDEPLLGPKRVLFRCRRQTAHPPPPATGYKTRAYGRIPLCGTLLNNAPLSLFSAASNRALFLLRKGFKETSSGSF